jgi:choline dehydrogenase
VYINLPPPRNDLHILLNVLVIRLLFQNGSEIGQGISNLTASAVEYASSPIFARYSVRVNKEVMLAGRVIGSLTILMQAWSGIGPRDVLQTASEVQVASDLPGIEQHLQDCVVGFIYFPF